MLVREHPFRLYNASHTHAIVVEEYISGIVRWPKKFRVVVDHPDFGQKTYYALTAYQAAKTAMADLVVYDGLAKIDGRAIRRVNPLEMRQIQLSETNSGECED